jgi:hypothetical protein
VKAVSNPPDVIRAEELLARLGVMPEEMATLAQQGSVSQEIRQRKGKPTGPYYKLRWRQRGRQRVRYLGRDPTLASSVRAALLQLQAFGRQARAVLEGLKQTRAYFAAAKKALQPLLGPGLYFHGYCIRRRRRTRPDPDAAQRDGRADSAAVNGTRPGTGAPDRARSAYADGPGVRAVAAPASAPGDHPSSNMR